ncbi:MAG: GtrA family protein [bacterium]|nr:GtrA family protein [bacterium]MDZ4285041.1 GtrA family protein [Patescibacteria group bacterium]
MKHLALFVSSLPRPLRYLISGGTALAVNLGLLAFFIEIFGLWYLLAAVLAFTVALCVSFALQKFFTFADHARTTGVLTRQFSIYTTIALINVALNTILMYLLVERLVLHYLVSQVVASGTIALYSFFIYRAVFNGAPLPQREKLA